MSKNLKDVIKEAFPNGLPAFPTEPTGQFRTISIPEVVMKALASRTNCQPVTVYHALWYMQTLVGVLGDGDNGWYDWFIWREGCEMRVSDAGYGDDSVALCSGLVEAEVDMAMGDHCVRLTWTRMD